MYDIVQRLDEAKKKKLELLPLPYGYRDLEPSISEKTLIYHHDQLAASYVKRFNSDEGDPSFNEAGAFLHNIYFPQFRSVREGNIPNGPVLTLIKRKFDSYRNFKTLFKKTAMSIQGSGWVYLSFSGEIKTIVNHEIRNDILLLVDWWEHAWALDYAADKSGYLENTWSIINWSHINRRWGKNL